MAKVINICDNNYIIPDEYEIEPISTTSVIYIEGKKVQVSNLYRITKYETIEGVKVESMLFGDLYLFEYAGFSYFVLRYVRNDGKVIKKVYKKPCFSNVNIQLGKILTEIENW